MLSPDWRRVRLRPVFLATGMGSRSDGCLWVPEQTSRVWRTRQRCEASMSGQSGQSSASWFPPSIGSKALPMSYSQRPSTSPGQEARPCLRHIPSIVMHPNRRTRHGSDRPPCSQKPASPKWHVTGLRGLLFVCRWQVAERQAPNMSVSRRRHGRPARPARPCDRLGSSSAARPGWPAASPRLPLR